MAEAQRRHFLQNILADAKRLDRLLLRLRELAHAELPSVKGQTAVAEAAAEVVLRFPGLEIASSGDVETLLPCRARPWSLHSQTSPIMPSSMERRGLSSSPPPTSACSRLSSRTIVRAFRKEIALSSSSRSSLPAGKMAGLAWAWLSPRLCLPLTAARSGFWRLAAPAPVSRSVCRPSADRATPSI